MILSRRIRCAPRSSLRINAGPNTLRHPPALRRGRAHGAYGFRCTCSILRTAWAGQRSQSGKSHDCTPEWIRDANQRPEGRSIHDLQLAVAACEPQPQECFVVCGVMRDCAAAVGSAHWCVVPTYSSIRVRIMMYAVRSRSRAGSYFAKRAEPMSSPTMHATCSPQALTYEDTPVFIRSLFDRMSRSKASADTGRALR